MYFQGGPSGGTPSDARGPEHQFPEKPESDDSSCPATPATPAIPPKLPAKSPLQPPVIPADKKRSSMDKTHISPKPEKPSTIENKISSLFDSDGADSPPPPPTSQPDPVAKLFTDEPPGLSDEEPPGFTSDESEEDPFGANQSKSSGKGHHYEIYEYIPDSVKPLKKLPQSKKKKFPWHRLPCCRWARSQSLRNQSALSKLTPRSKRNAKRRRRKGSKKKRR